MSGPIGSADAPGREPTDAPETEDSYTPALTQAAIRFAEAEQASAQVHLQSVVEALSPLEASLLEFQAASARIDRDAIVRLWSESEALLKRMREELAGPPFRAPARSLLRGARRSADRLHTLKPALADLDALMPRVWGTSALVDGVRELLAEVELGLEGQSSSGSPRSSPTFRRSYSSRLGLGPGKAQQAAPDKLRAVATDLQQLVASLQELGVSHGALRLQAAVQSAHDSLERTARAIARLPTHLSTLLYHLLQAEPGAKQSEAALSQVRSRRRSDWVVQAQP
jgi:hypothetical protein